jgi:UTP--glucose-1-phosphate uridylyltransferase
LSSNPVARDGLAKPAILLIVEEALSVDSIEQVCIVIGPGDRKAFSKLFHKPLSEKHNEKLSPAMREYHQHLMDVGSRGVFAEQGVQDGFGSAVYAAASFVGGESFLLLLGDHIHRSKQQHQHKPLDHHTHHHHQPPSCAQQLVSCFRSHSGRSVVGVVPSTMDQLSSFGCVSIDPKTYSITAFAEKPTAQWAMENLAVPG